MPASRSDPSDDSAPVPPWRQLFHGEAGTQEQQQEQQQREQPQQPQPQPQPQQRASATAAAATTTTTTASPSADAEPGEAAAPAQQHEQLKAPLTELQEQLLLVYRKTFLVAGLGLAGSVWRWNAVTKHQRQHAFLPPRAQALPPELVRQWQDKAALREALRTVGRQTAFITGVAALYFGSELGVGLARGETGAWPNTAAAGALAGGLLGARVPSSMRGRTCLLGTAVGGLMGAASGWLQQQLARYTPAAEGADVK